MASEVGNFWKLQSQAPVHLALRLARSIEGGSGPACGWNLGGGVAQKSQSHQKASNVQVPSGND